jgi:hypothetical protein
MGHTGFAHISAGGSIRYGQAPGSIGVLMAMFEPLLIGLATCTT